MCSPSSSDLLLHTVCKDTQLNSGLQDLGELYQNAIRILGVEIPASRRQLNDFGYDLAVSPLLNLSKFGVNIWHTECEMRTTHTVMREIKGIAASCHVFDELEREVTRGHIGEFNMGRRVFRIHSIGIALEFQWFSLFHPNNITVERDRSLQVLYCESNVK